jgi:hypothetical protein
VERAGIHILGQAQLPDAPEPLKKRMLHQVEQQRAGQGDKPIDRVVENLFLVEISHRSEQSG